LAVTRTRVSDYEESISSLAVFAFALHAMTSRHKLKVLSSGGIASLEIA